MPSEAQVTNIFHSINIHLGALQSFLIARATIIIQ